MPDYSGERYNPTLAHCSELTLYFNGTSLIMRGGKNVYTYAAVSGKPNRGRFDYSKENQKQRNSGPIPEGVYWIRPDELWENAWYKVAPRGSWGNYRITIHPFQTTETHTRGGFFIHGGTEAGSAGCIDLTGEMDRFVADLKKELKGIETCQIHLFVSYNTVSHQHPRLHRTAAAT
jgi:hypothetical protein